MRALLTFMCQPWALHEPVLRSACEIVERHLRGERLPADVIAGVVAEREARRARRAEIAGRTVTFSGVCCMPMGGVPVAMEDDYEPTPRNLTGRPETTKAGEHGYYMDGSVAVVPVEGVIAKYASMVNGSSQPEGTSTDAIVSSLANARDNPKARSVLLAIDSPGGMVAGLPNVMDAIQGVKAVKPVVAFADGMMASAAYWIGSQAESVIASPEASVGSIGVYTLVEDSSKFYENRGIRLNLVKAGAFKGIGADGIPVTAEQLATVQQNIDAHYRSFVDGALVKGRGKSAEQALALADGRVHVGAESVVLGLADGSGLLHQVTARMNEQYGTGGGAPDRSVPFRLAHQR